MDLQITKFNSLKLHEPHIQLCHKALGRNISGQNNLNEITPVKYVGTEI